MKVGEFITLLEQVKLKNSVYKDLKWQQSYIPHHKQEIEQLVDALGKRRVAWGLNNISYYSQKQSHGKLGTLALCLLVLSPILYLQIKGGKKQWQEILVLTSLSLALSTFTVYCWWPKLISLFFHKEIEIYKRGMVIMEQDTELMDYCIVEEREKTEGEYIESIKGAVSAAEFEMHTSYLRNVDNEKFAKYKETILKIRRTGHQKVRKEFIRYVNAIRDKKINDEEYAIHISHLRCYERVDEDKVYFYKILFVVTKEFFWQLVPSYYQSDQIEDKVVENFYQILSKIDYEKATLEVVLKQVGLLNLVNDHEELLEVLKKTLTRYHPDKNKHKKAQEIFSFIKQNIYNPIDIILEQYDKFTDYSDNLCNLDEFLYWPLKKIKRVRELEGKLIPHGTPEVQILEWQDEIQVINDHFISVYNPISDDHWICVSDVKERLYNHNNFEISDFKKEKKIIFNKKDEICLGYRELVNQYNLFAEKKFLQKRKETDLKNVKGKDRKKIIREEIDDLSKEIKEDNSKISEIEKEIRKQKEEMRPLVELILETYDPMILDIEKKIGKLKDLYLGIVGYEEKWKYKIELFKFNRKKTREIEEEIRKEKLNCFVDERRMKNLRFIAEKLKEEKEVMTSLLTQLPIRVEKRLDYVTDSRVQKQCSSALIKSLSKRLPICDFNESNKKGLSLEYFDICKQYKSLREQYKLIKRHEDLMDLNSKLSSLQEKFKTEEEKERREEELNNKRKNERLKLRKEPLNQRKKNRETYHAQEYRIAGVIQLGEEAIIAAEAKAEEAEAKAEGERAAREEAEARSKATGNMFSEAAIIGIVDKVVSDQKLQEFLIDQFKLVVLYEGLKDKYQNLAHEYVQLWKELIDCEVIVDRAAQNPEEISKEDIFERRSSLVKESDKLDEKLKKLNEEYAQEKPTFENEKIEEFKRDTLSKVEQAREGAEKNREMVENEKTKVKAMVVEKTQILATPSLTLNDASLGPQAGPSWKM